MPDLLEEGLRLFNEGKFYDAHEVWEDLWRATPEPSLKTSYQGLIQAAVGLHHLHHRNPRGAHSQLQKSIRNLEAGASEATGLDVPGLIRQLVAILERIDEPAVSSAGMLRIARLK